MMSTSKGAVSWEDDSDYEEIPSEEQTDQNAAPTAPPKKKKKDSPKEVKVSCQYFNAVFAPNNNDYALIECLGPEIPSSSIYKISVDPIGKPITAVYMLQNNTVLKEKVAKIALPQIKTFPVMISGGYNAQVRLYLPPGLREDEITKYPMIVHV